MENTIDKGGFGYQDDQLMAKIRVTQVACSDLSQPAVKQPDDSDSCGVLNESQ